MGYFDLFSSKMLFVFKFKACMDVTMTLYWELQNDCIRRYTEQLILFLAKRTDHRVTRKCKLLSFSDLYVVYPNNDIRTPKSCKYGIL